MYNANKNKSDDITSVSVFRGFSNVRTLEGYRTSVFRSSEGLDTGSTMLRQCFRFPWVLQRAHIWRIQDLGFSFIRRTLGPLCWDRGEVGESCLAGNLSVYRFVKGKLCRKCHYCCVLSQLKNVPMFTSCGFSVMLLLLGGRGGSMGRASDSRSEEPRFEPRQDHKNKN